MHPTQIAAVLECLMSGIDPRIGSVFPRDSPYHDKDVIAALGEAVASYKANHGLIEIVPANAGKPRSTTEDEKLLQAIDRDRTAPEIAGKLDKTRPGIDVRSEDLRSRGEFRSSGYKAGTMDEGCANCGQGYGQHYNGACPAVSLS